MRLSQKLLLGQPLKLFDGAAQAARQETKFGNVAVQTLINKFINSGPNPNYLEATVVGGAFIIFDEKEIFFIGDRNAEIAAQILKNNNISIKQVNTGGEHGKKVLFNTVKNQSVVQSLEHIDIDDLYNPAK